MDEIRFGPSGNSSIFFADGNKNSLQAPQWCANHGLGAYEYSFGRGFTMSMETAIKLGENAKENNIALSLHAPYYINLANESQEMIEKSFQYITKGLQYLKAMSGCKYIVHLASCGKLPRDKALSLTSKRLDDCLQVIYDNNLDDAGLLCPETMGKYLQIGTYQEIIDFCKKDKILVPTFDFGHINCILQGGLKTKDDFKRIFDYSIDKIGLEKTKNCHIHFSKIEFSEKGEIRHLNLDDKLYGPRFEPLASVLKEYELIPTVICESRDRMMEDAITLKGIYDSCK